MNILNHVAAKFESLDPNWKTKTFLLGLSGGLDSMTLLHIAQELGINISVAHFNFKLRGEESDMDEAFIKSHCIELQIPAFTNSKDTLEYCNEHKLSIQEGARELRYNWFNALVETEGFDYILTAHHGNDVIETFFINLLRGSGIKGLSSIPELNDKIMRPLLEIDKSSLEKYAKAEYIPYREDSSNLSSKYLRNNLRHDVLPGLRKLSKDTDESILSSIKYLKEANTFIEEKIEEELSPFISNEKNETKLKIEHTCSDFALKTWLRKFGFKSEQTEQLTQHTAGKKLTSSTHELLVDREEFIIRPLESISIEEFIIPDARSISTPLHLAITIEEVPSSIKRDPNIAMLDLEKVKFPLKLRKWKHGDAFIPLGMQGKKKLSDYFIDEKINSFDKEKIWILEDSEKMVWIVGKRIDNRVKITNSTQKIIQIVTH